MKNFKSILLFIPIFIIVLGLIVFCVDNYTKKIVEEYDTKNIANKLHINANAEIDKYTKLKSHLDTLCTSLDDFEYDKINDNSSMQRLYYNKSVIFDKERKSIEEAIKAIIGDVTAAEFNNFINDFEILRDEKCKKFSYGIDNNILKNIEYYKNYEQITKNFCYELLEKYKKDLSDN